MANIKFSIGVLRAPGIAIKLQKKLDPALISKMVATHRKVTQQEFREGAQFLAGGGSATWAPRKAFGTLSKRPAGPANITSGRLYAAIGGGPGGFSRINKLSARWGVSMSYAAYHRGGAKQQTTAKQRAFLHGHGIHLKPGSRIVLPARPWGGDSLRLRRELGKTVREHFKGGR